MKFTLTLASNRNHKEPIEIYSMNALKMLYDIYGTDLIIDFETMTIKVYDDYIE